MKSKKDKLEQIGANLFGITFLGTGIAFLWLPFVGEFNIFFLIISAVPGVPFTIIGISTIVFNIMILTKSDNNLPITRE